MNAISLAFRISEEKIPVPVTYRRQLARLFFFDHRASKGAVLFGFRWNLNSQSQLGLFDASVGRTEYRRGCSC